MGFWLRAERPVTPSTASTEPLVYVDGQYIARSQAKVSVFDHGFLYGDGVFEGIRAYDGTVFRLKEHLDRLYRSAKYIRLKIPFEMKEMTDVALETLRRNKIRTGYLRIVVSRGYGDLGLDPRKCKKATVVAIAENMPPLHGSQAKNRGLNLIISGLRRDRVDATSHECKSLNYLNSILARIEAYESGADDSVMLDSRGYVSEATGSNLFIVEKEEFLTPPTSAGILHGITRSRIIRLVKEMGHVMYERDITPFELLSADEVFLTGTGSEIVPVVKIDGIEVGNGKPGPLTLSVMEKFQKIVREPKEGTAIYD